MDGQVEGGGQGTPPPVNEYLNKYEEEKRKRESMEQEINILREQRLREMAAQPAPQYMYNQPTPEPEDEDLAQMDPVTRRAVEKMLAKKETEFKKYTEDSARKTYYKESVKAQAVTLYPDLKNADSPFFKKVAFFMDTHKEKYNEPEGILDACARVAYEMNMSRAPSNARSNEQMRQQASSGAAAVEGAGASNASVDPSMDTQGQVLAAKLGIDPKKMAARLSDLENEKGVYAPREGKTGKASI